jgi:hypothetical protein
MSLTLCVLLWARPSAEDGLIAYENQVLGIAAEHECRVLQRVRGSGGDGQRWKSSFSSFLRRRRSTTS